MLGVGSNRGINNLIFILSLFVVVSITSFAQYANFRLIEPRDGSEPQPLAILWSTDKASALVHYENEHINVVNKSRIDKEWIVKEIKRESIIFGRTSDKKYVEYYINPDNRPHKKYRTWSFYGLPITLWEAAKMLTEAFGYNCVMHNLCSGTVIPQRNAVNFNELLHSIIPQNIFAKLENDTLYIFPKKTPNEEYKAILKRKKDFNHKALAMRFPGLEKKGTVKSKGYDIQYILRVISLGGEVPISFPNDLHFLVYADYKEVPFHKILSDIVYTNQCVVIEREYKLEIIRWPTNTFANGNGEIADKNPVPLPLAKKDYITVDPYRVDEKSGAGPYPPPLLPDYKSIIPSSRKRTMGYYSDERGHPIVVQP